MAQWMFIVAVLCCHYAISDAGPLQMEVYLQERAIDKYLYQRSLPELTENTICMWANFGADDDFFTSDFMLTISHSTNTDAFWIGLDGTYLILGTGGTGVTFDVEFSDVEALLKEWHKHCFLWKSNEYVQWYSDQTTSGVLELMNSQVTHSYTLPAGGELILLQEQDSLFGSLDVNEAMPGKISGFNMWNYAMEDYELRAVRCRDQGNVVSWDTLSEQGVAKILHESFPCKDEIAAGTSCSTTIYTQEANPRHMYEIGTLPEMSENTACFWISTDAVDDDGRSEDYLITISTSSNFNEYRLGWTYNQSLGIEIKGSVALLNGNDTVAAENDLLFVGWHKHCFTFKNGGYFTWYADRTTYGVMELIKSVPFSPGVIGADGKLKLMNDQDSWGSDLEADQATIGDITWFQMWDYELTEEQVKALTCDRQGNLVRWDTMRAAGVAVTYQGSISDLQYQAPELEDLSNRKVITDKSQTATLCKIPRASLDGVDYNMYTMTAGSSSRCVLLCAKEVNCQSVNYQYSSGSCTLNNDIDQGNEEAFITGLASDFVHFSARECGDY